MADTLYAGNKTYLGGTSGNDVMVANNSTGTHLDGGRGSDNINGGDGNDIIQGGRGNDYLWGGNGNDTFLFLQKEQDGGTDKIFDFGGAGEKGGDVLQLYGFSSESTLTLMQTDTGMNGHMIFKYDLYDAATGLHNVISIESVNGQALGAGDILFGGQLIL
jgi:Ca2+-binding RTX toxin-like protein